MGYPDVKLKRKVQLREKSDEADVGTTATPSKSKAWAWLWGVAALAVIIFGVWAFSKSDNTADGQQENDNLAAAGEQSETVESAISVEVPEGSTDDNTSAGASETESAVSDLPSEDAKTISGDSAETASKATAGNQKSKSVSANVSSDVEAEAMKVIRGDYGNGVERKDRLGSNYQAIQNRVNELKREGLF